MQDTDQHLTPREAAERLDVSEGTVRRWVREGYMRAQRMPGRKGRIRIPASEVARVGGRAA